MNQVLSHSKLNCNFYTFSFGVMSYSVFFASICVGRLTGSTGNVRYTLYSCVGEVAAEARSTVKLG